jgi:propionyl-CoA carboxylase alpha chain
VKLKGWAIEARVYAEDPTRNFLPSIGRLVKYHPPTEQVAGGVTVRNDTGVGEGGEISIFYDPMIAKLCTHAPTRMQAIAAMANALDSFYVEGIRHNISFLSAIMDHPRWQAGQLSTGFIAEEFPQGFAGAALSPEITQKFVATACLLDHIENRRKRKISGQMDGRRVKFATTREVKLGADWHKINVTAETDTMAETSEWTPRQAVVSAYGLTLQVDKLANGYRISHRGVTRDAFVYTTREAELVRLMPKKKIADTSKKLLCPMPGLVINIAVVEGQDVKAGDTLAIVEAMKMENVLRAERDVKIKKINAKQGDSLGVDMVMMEYV